MKSIEKLLEPGRIGHLELKNRVIFSAMDLRSTDGHGHMSPEAVTSFVERAKHGVGLVSLPGAYAWQNPGVPHGKTISLESDDFIPPLADAARRAHEAGAKVMIQIGARGTRIEGSVSANTGPTSMRFGYEPIIPRELSIEEIQQRVEWFGDAARRAREAGIDIVEIHACTVNPELLREPSYDTLTPSSSPKHIVVVGGGLAGMECSRVLAGRGHKVTLLEKDAELGGQWIVASHAPHKNEEKTLIPWLKRELEKAGVDVRLNHEASVESIAALDPDDIVIATGAKPKFLPLEVPAGGPNVVQGNDVIMDRAETGHRVVVIGGRYIGMECAVKLAKEGHHVSVVDAVEIGHGTNPRILGIYRNEMVENDVFLFPNSPVLRFMDYGVDIAHLNSMLSLKADTIVLAVGTRPVNGLASELEQAGFSFHLIGDCKRIGDALYAMRDGADMGRQL